MSDTWHRPVVATLTGSDDAASGMSRYEAR
jgi:hypothetical protein